MSHCGRFIRPMTRRQMLARCANGFGTVALAGLLGRAAGASASASAQRAGPNRCAHFTPHAKNVIFLFMDGGPSQVDTFDYKPLLEKHHGADSAKAMGRLEPTQFASVGKVMQSPWKFGRRGQSGLWVSDLFPHVATCVDELAVIKSMTTDVPEHTTGSYLMHTGSALQGRPSMGAWINYGLGSTCDNLPGYVVVDGGVMPAGGLDNFTAGFLPAAHQGSIFKPTLPGIANAAPADARPELQRRKLALMKKLDASALEQIGPVDAVESAIANYEVAFRMQAAVPELVSLAGETDATKKLYGLDSANAMTRTYATQCLMARRLVERGVRFVELSYPSGISERWDQHGDIMDHAKNALAVDQPIAGLLKDLRSRGMLDETLVIWAGEFGRTPFAQGGKGRDHNPQGFTVWLAGGGVRGGVAYGSTDDWGYKAVDDRCTMNDLHATILRLLGIDHTRLTFHYSGRDMRLTDVAGRVVTEILA